jgi:hypothetical protein
MAPPTDYVLQVYLTEAAAKVGDTSTALAVDSAGKINQVTGSLQAAGYGFWTHTKYWYRIEANEPVKEFYIDWDDGEDNDPKGKANYSSIKFDTPTFVGIISHIYTGNSRISGGFFPKIRCKSVDGFWSKFYQNAAATPSATPISTGIDILQGETALTVGRNNKYRVESDNTTERIPALYPTIKPPIGILKADKKRLYAGINNSWLGGTSGTIGSGGMTVILKSAPDFDSVRTAVTVRVTYMRTGVDATTDADRGDISVTDMTLGGSNLSNVSKILKVELLNLLEDSVPFNGSSPSTSKLYPGEKMVLIADTYNVIKQQTIAEVSLGNPIVILDEARNTVTYDLTESFARTSEQSISNYYLNDGGPLTNAGWIETQFQQDIGNTEAAHSDFMEDTVQSIPDGIAKRSYSFDINHNYVDSDHRWLPTQLLARGQIKVSNPSGMTTALIDHQYSFLEHWLNEGHTANYSDTVNASTAYNWPSDVTSSAVIAFKSTYDTDRWTDLDNKNRRAGGPSQYIMRSGPDAADIYYFGHEDADTLADVDNKAMLVCARDSKWTKQYFRKAHNNTSVSQGRADVVIPGSTLDNADGWDGVGHMNTRVQTFYTGYENGQYKWKPLKILNNTKHPDYDDTTWYTSGSFEWEEPDDWKSIDPDQIEDYFYPRGDYFEPEASGAHDEKSWAYSTHNQAGSQLEDTAFVAAVSEVATIVVEGAKFSGNNEISSKDLYDTSATTDDVEDGLSIVVGNDPANVRGRYFKFTEQQTSGGGDNDWYCWFKQAATPEAVAFKVTSNGSSTDADWYDFVDQPAGGQSKASTSVIIQPAPSNSRRGYSTVAYQNVAVDEVGRVYVADNGSFENSGAVLIGTEEIRYTNKGSDGNGEYLTIGTSGGGRAYNNTTAAVHNISAGVTELEATDTSSQDTTAELNIDSIVINMQQGCNHSGYSCNSRSQYDPFTCQQMADHIVATMNNVGGGGSASANYDVTIDATNNRKIVFTDKDYGTQGNAALIATDLIYRYKTSSSTVTLSIPDLSGAQDATAVYGRHFTIKNSSNQNIAFWLSFGTVTYNGYTGPTISPWLSGIYDGNPGPDIGLGGGPLEEGTIHSAPISIDVSAAYNTGGSPQEDAVLIDTIATAIASEIQAHSSFVTATKVVQNTDERYIDVVHATAGVVDGFTWSSNKKISFIAQHTMNSISNHAFFTGQISTGSNGCVGSYNGKAIGQNPSPTYQDLAVPSEIIVPYTDTQTKIQIATALTSEINTSTDGGNPSANLNAVAARNSATVTLTQTEGGAVANITDGVADSVVTDDLDLRTLFSITAETVAGVDSIAATYGNDYFEDGDIWNSTNKKYALMFIIETDSGASGKANSYGYTDILDTWPCSNSHSSLIDLIDPMCVSLNSRSFAQGISFVHKGKYQIVKDRLGKSDIRKIGSEGGTMKFGGIDLSSETDRLKFYEFQSQATPVYLDVEHRNGDFSRFFGVIIDMSEDHPTGKVIPKFGVSMVVSHMITMDSSGTILSDGYISLGGNIDEPSYL